MVDSEGIFLIISAVVLAVVGLVTVTIALIKFAHPDDKNQAKFPRIVVILGFFWAFASVLILPFDVANQRKGGAGIEVGLLWQIIFFIIAVWVVIVIPFAFNYYESDVDSDTLRENNEGMCGTQMCQALKYTIFTFIIFALIFGITYPFLSFASIPVQQQVVSVLSVVPAGTQLLPEEVVEIPEIPEVPVTNKCPKDFPSDFSWIFDPDFDIKGVELCSTDAWDWNLQVTFPIYIMALMSFIGWFAFVVFAGIGLIALPMDLITDFLGRPRPINVEEYTRQKINIGERAQKLIESGQAIQDIEIEQLGRKSTRKERRDHQALRNKYEKAVYILKADYMYIKKAHLYKGGNPIWYWFELILGIIGTSISLSWVIHICIFLLPPEPLHPFLNNLFIKMSFDGFDFFGVITFTCYATWLLWACIKGNFKIGLRIPFVLKIYPMELENTLMNAFLVNTWIILLCSFPCVQFCAIAFPIYARGTAIDLIFGTQVRYMKFFSYFFDNNVFVYALAILALISIPLLLIFRKDKGQDIEDELAKERAAIDREAARLANS